MVSNFKFTERENFTCYLLNEYPFYYQNEMVEDKEEMCPRLSSPSALVKPSSSPYFADPSSPSSSSFYVWLFFIPLYTALVLLGLTVYLLFILLYFFCCIIFSHLLFRKFIIVFVTNIRNYHLPAVHLKMLHYHLLHLIWNHSLLLPLPLHPLPIHPLTLTWPQ